MTTAAGQVDTGRPASPPLAALATAFTALCAFGVVHWMAMVEPVDPAREALAIAVAAGTGLALRSARGRRAPMGSVIVAGFALALLAGGVPLGRLRPDRWGALASDISSGTAAVAGARIPYDGLDAQLRLVIAIGGTLLALAAGLLAFWPRRDGATGFRAGALVALVGLYAVPAVALELKFGFLRGAALTLLVLAFWCLGRVRAGELSGAVALAASAAVVALVAAPALDTRRPWFDYEDFIQGAAGAHAASFDWDHDYAGFVWPRDGRELLRITSRQRAYWKAEDLDLFDGTEWVRNPVLAGVTPAAGGHEGVDPERVRAWSFQIDVSVRNLRSRTLPIAGVAASVKMPGRTPELLRPGIWSAGRSIHRGDTYRAQVFVPEPSAAELEAAGTGYAPQLASDTAFNAISPPFRGIPRPVQVFVPTFFKGTPRIVGYGSHDSARPALRHSNLRRLYELSRRLQREAATPYDYVQAIRRYLGNGFRYDESPPAASRTLDGFLFDSHAGFCQQYSGAMALLLRMGGVPARVATGFAPGSYDRNTKQYVVRDVDAHSWVEAWFEGAGWVVFDPTPAAAPPRSQALTGSPSAGRGDLRDIGITQSSPAPGPAEGTGASWALIGLGGGGAAALAAAAWWLWTRRGRPRPTPATELERALRVAGGPSPPGTTLSALEARFGATPSAAGYVRAVRAARYAPAPGSGPTPAQRRGLRRAVARGRGPAGRLRAWLALPPRLRGTGRGLH